MTIELIRLSIADAETVWRMQREAFQDLLAKYQDVTTSPANESLENIQRKLRANETYFYGVFIEERIVGAVRVVDRKNGSRKRIAPIFILRDYRRRGIAKQVFKMIEDFHGSSNWELDTILQETSTVSFYERLGYKPTGLVHVINDNMTIAYYHKD
ncbi:GNAT family N-acetyltransferase [Streptococcus fryi]